MHGLSDIDGEGEYAEYTEYTANLMHSAMLVTAPEVY